MTIGQRVKQLRKQRGITQKFMAERLGYKSYSAYCMAENGDRKFPSDKIKPAADILDVDVSLFFEENVLDTRSVNEG